MSNIIIENSINDLPNELLGHIASFVDPYSQKALSQVDSRFRAATIDQAKIDAKIKLQEFKKFILEKGDASYQLYEKEVTLLCERQQLPESNKEAMLGLYPIEQEKADLENTLENVFQDNDEICSLEDLKAKECQLFKFLTTSQIALFVIHKLPNLTSEMPSEQPRWLSGYDIMHAMMRRYATFNQLQNKLTDVRNNNPADAEQLRALNKDLYKELLILIEDGYAAAGIDFLPTFTGSKQLKILYHTVISLKIHGLWSPRNQEKIVKAICFSLNTQDDNHKFKILTRLFKLPLSQEKRSEILQIISHLQSDYHKVRVLTKLCKLPLSQEERSEVLQIISHLQRDNHKVRVLVRLCKLPLSQEERSEILQIISHLHDDDHKFEVLLRLCKLPLSQEERSEILQIMFGIPKNPYQKNVLNQIYKLLLSEENSHDPLENILIIENSHDPLENILIIENRHDPLENILIIENRHEKLAGLLNEIANLSDKIAEIYYESTFNIKNKKKIKQANEELKHLKEKRCNNIRKFKKFKLSQEERSEVLQFVHKMNCELDKAHLLKILCKPGLNSKEIQKIFIIAMTMEDSERRVVILEALFSV
ncbi:MAG: F-box protein [Chlamydiota bacterium]